MPDSRQPTPLGDRVQPTRQAIARSDRLRVLTHPLAASLVTTLRDITTPTHEFAWAVQELTRHLLWDALQNEPTERHDIRGFSGETTRGVRFLRRPALLAIMRAGLGMVPPTRALLPDVSVYQIGLKRDEQTLEPDCYYSNLPEAFDGIGHLLILDPMLATGGSASLVVRQVRQRFDGDISFIGLLGAPFGVSQLLEADPVIRIVLAELDERLNEQGYIVPGLGDAGDRLYGTDSPPLP